jgi:serine/threonine protein kinase
MTDRGDGRRPSASESASAESELRVPLLGRYVYEKRLGAGSFGEVYQVLDNVTNERLAVKIESKSIKAPQLVIESEIYDLTDGERGFPKKRFFLEDETSSYLGMDMLGPSIENVFQNQRGYFTVREAFRFGAQAIDLIRTLHNKGFVARDIKTENFLFARDFPEDKQVFMIDFGLVKRYIDPVTKSHIPMRIRNALTGTVRYSSLNAHRGMEQGRRDDLESLGYVMLYLLRGSLPWQGLRVTGNENKYAVIFEAKKKVELSFICRGLPEEILKFLHYTRELEYEEKPDYDAMIGLMNAVVDNPSQELDKIAGTGEPVRRASVVLPTSGEIRTLSANNRNNSSEHLPAANLTRRGTHFTLRSDMVPKIDENLKVDEHDSSSSSEESSGSSSSSASKRNEKKEDKPTEQGCWCMSC